MKKFLYLSYLSVILIFSNYLQADSKIAIINLYDLLQKLPQKTSILKRIENEFRDRENKLQFQKNDLQNKINTLERNKSIMKLSEKQDLENYIIKQRNSFSIKVQIFEQDKNRRQIEERNKVLNKIQTSIIKIARKYSLNLVIDSKATIYTSSIKDITVEVLKNIK
ncbi:OmpH family outer membrane protein [Candidatus Pantoea edessiphila]|uniref:Chaperone protein Skp n=1 Tax=Candidatus Pantoea edessiphila TaxID=2044610 RepID=A0A2P5SWB0_9GAMM|nr:OmpH family outer membrane protein [Candidatus Pantoea edessiphila]PPI86628.1 molecular chaperone [Candidatus Pantoea edessiphila]